jgi:hypothetical protein
MENLPLPQNQFRECGEVSHTHPPALGRRDPDINSPMFTVLFHEATQVPHVARLSGLHALTK